MPIIMVLWLVIMILNINQDNTLIRKNQIVRLNMLRLTTLYTVIVTNHLMSHTNIKIILDSDSIINIT